MSDRSRYEKNEQIGAGAMGVVYRAYDTVLDRYVALKVLRIGPDLDDEVRERFRREARFGARLHHPNIAIVHDLGDIEGAPYIAMELLEGADLRRYIEERRPLPLEQKLRLLAEVCDGLAHAHRESIIHRDIKPSNIFIHREEQAKILDFGIARLPTSTLTAVGDILGTPNYMSPEQMLCRPTDSRSDLFSAAIVFFEFLAYAHPFRSAFIPRRIAEGSPDRLYDYLPEIPPQLEDVIQKALAKRPEDRFQTASEFGAELRQIAALMESAIRKKTEFDVLAHKFDETITSDPAAAAPFLDQMRDLTAIDSRFEKSLDDCERRFEATRALQTIRPMAVGAAVGADPVPLMPAPLLPLDPEPVIGPAAEEQFPPEPPVEITSPQPQPAPALPTLRQRAAGFIILWTARLWSLPPARKYAILAAVCIVLTLPVGALVLFDKGIDKLPFKGQATLKLATEILERPRPLAKPLAALQPGEHLNVLDDLQSWRQDWIRVQYVSYDKHRNSPPGYTHVTDIQWPKELVDPVWKSLLGNSPTDASTDDKIRDYITELEEFSTRFPVMQAAVKERQDQLQAILNERIKKIADGSKKTEDEKKEAPEVDPDQTAKKVANLLKSIESEWSSDQLDLALRNVKRVLQLAPNNADAKAWKIKIEDARKALGQG